MLVKWIKRLLLLAVGVAIVFAGSIMIKPKPVAVDMVSIKRGLIETIISEEGKTRVRDVYRISTPISGKLERLTVDEGDMLEKGQRIARIRATDAPIRDVRTRREMVAASKAARASVQLARAELSKVMAAQRFAVSELERAKRLSRSRTISKRAMQKAELELSLKNAQVEEAKANLELARRQYETATVRQSLPGNIPQTNLEDQCCVGVITPVSGTVLKLLKESEQVVHAGTLLVDVGDLRKQEIVVDLLSEDAVTIEPGTQARITGWGGKGVLAAKVRRIDPAAFTKVSALGIEEQRVNVVLDITDNPDRWKKLGHSFRVTVNIITSSHNDALRVPLGALFRKGDQWAVYKNVDGIARYTAIKLGTMSQEFAEVTDGLAEGAQVIIYPSDRIKDGVAVIKR